MAPENCIVAVEAKLTCNSPISTLFPVTLLQLRVTNTPTQKVRNGGTYAETSNISEVDIATVPLSLKLPVPSVELNVAILTYDVSPALVGLIILLKVYVDIPVVPPDGARVITTLLAVVSGPLIVKPVFPASYANAALL